MQEAARFGCLQTMALQMLLLQLVLRLLVLLLKLLQQGPKLFAGREIPMCWKGFCFCCCGSPSCWLHLDHAWL
jgi:hypothetical protein